MNQKLKLSLSACALAAVSFIGLRDTGVFVQDHTTTLYSGNKLSFAIEEEANIVETNNKGYVVQKGNAKVTVPKEKILVTEGPARQYIVRKNIPLKKDGKVVRNLFLGEVLTMKKIWPENIEVTTDDGLYGSVARSAVEAAEGVYYTPAKVKEELVLDNENGEWTLKEGQEVRVLDYQDGLYVLLNGEDKVYAIDPVYLDFGEDGAKVIKSQATQPQEERSVAVPVNVPSANNAVAQQVINSAFAKLGTPYVWGGTSAAGYDCSGLVYAIYVNELGYSLPRTSKDMSEVGNDVSRENLEPGDLLFFNTTGSGVSHVAIYIGNDEFIHASSGGGQVKTNKLSETYYSTRFVNATRVLY